MALSRKQLKELKTKMSIKNPSGFQAAKQAAKQNRKVNNNKIVKDDNFSKRKSVIRYSFKPNQLVEIIFGDQKIIGLIISDFEFFSRRVEKNCFFVLVKSSVQQFDGRYIRQL